MTAHHRYNGEYSDIAGLTDLSERIAKSRAFEDAKREACQCKHPVKVRRYLGQWACVCGRVVAE